jgi:hypothetical protein
LEVRHALLLPWLIHFRLQQIRPSAQRMLHSHCGLKLPLPGPKSTRMAEITLKKSASPPGCAGAAATAAPADPSSTAGKVAKKKQRKVTCYW